jgi:hypothetical protein
MIREVEREVIVPMRESRLVETRQRQMSREEKQFQAHIYNFFGEPFLFDNASNSGITRDCCNLT